MNIFGMAVVMRRKNRILCLAENKISDGKRVGMFLEILGLLLSVCSGGLLQRCILWER